MNKSRVLAAMVLAVSLLTACSPQKSAEQAVDTAEQALADIHEIALKYTPQRYGKVKAELDAARSLLGEGKFKEALAIATDLPGKAKEVGGEAITARDKLLAELEVEWDTLGSGVPEEISSLESRIGELTGMKRLPKGIDAEALKEAQEWLPTVQQAWTEAQSAHEKGDLEAAVARAAGAQQLAAALIKGLTPVSG